MNSLRGEIEMERGNLNVSMKAILPNKVRVSFYLVCNENDTDFFREFSAF